MEPLSGVTAADNQDGDLTKKVVIADDGGFDASKPGTYTITYRVTDSAGLTTEVKRTVTVTATASPSASSAPGQSGQSNDGGAALPYTGANVAIGASIAAVLLAFGGIAFAFARRRRSQHD